MSINKYKKKCIVTKIMSRLICISKNDVFNHSTMKYHPPKVIKILESWAYPVLSLSATPTSLPLPDGPSGGYGARMPTDSLEV